MIGVVIARSGENWRVDIGAAHMANLDGLAFEGATKRNRPNLKVCIFHCNLSGHTQKRRRSVRCSMRAYRSRTKTWNQS